MARLKDGLPPSGVGALYGGGTSAYLGMPRIKRGKPTQRQQELEDMIYEENHNGASDDLWNGARRKTPMRYE